MRPIDTTDQQPVKKRIAKFETEREKILGAMQLAVSLLTEYEERYEPACCQDDLRSNARFWLGKATQLLSPVLDLDPKESRPQSTPPSCTHCGSNDVQFDAVVEWNHDTYDFEVVAVMDGGHVCEDCGSETSIEWR